jgi:hypothetical protein
VSRACLGAATLVAVLATALPLAAAQAEESPLVGAVRTDDVASRTVRVPVPDGVVPRLLLGTVRVDAGPGTGPSGTLDVLVDGRVVQTRPARPRAPLRLPVRRADLSRGGDLEVGLRWTSGCAAPGTTASLDDLRLVHGGAERAPTSEADFLGPAATRVDVVVPRSATDDVLEAALESVALLTAHYGDGVPVRMHVADAVLPRTGAGQRVLRLEPGATLSRGLEQRFGLWTLTLKGPGAALRNTVREALGPATTPTPAPALTLADLDVPTALGGWGTSSTRIPVRQDLLTDGAGTAGATDGVDGVTLHLEGTHSAVPTGTLARLDVRLDGVLLESVDLAEDDLEDVDLDVAVPGERLRAGSELEVVLTAVPDGGCAAVRGALPVELDLDPVLSTLSAGRGDTGATGFQRLPATLGGELAVGIRTRGEQRAEAASDAGLLVAALQRAAGLPLDVTLVSPEELVSGDQPGLLVGADATDTLAVQAPVRLEDGGGDAPVPAEGRPFAALQAVEHRGRDLLVLGTWSPDPGQGADGARGAGDPTRLERALAERTLTRGWGALEGGALVQEPGGRPVTVAATPPTDPRAGSEDEGNPYAPYLLGAAALLVLALLVQAGLVIRKDRRLRAAGGAGALRTGRPRQQP